VSWPRLAGISPTKYPATTYHDVNAKEKECNFYYETYQEERRQVHAGDGCVQVPDIGRHAEARASFIQIHYPIVIVIVAHETEQAHHRESQGTYTIMTRRATKD
jgi:hypothetical protein